MRAPARQHAGAAASMLRMGGAWLLAQAGWWLTPHSPLACLPLAIGLTAAWGWQCVPHGQSPPRSSPRPKWGPAPVRWLRLPAQAAGVAMLLMMLAMPALRDLCGAGAQALGGALPLAHAALMIVPWAACRLAPGLPQRRRSRPSSSDGPTWVHAAVQTSLLCAAPMAILALPGAAGWMTAMLCQAGACGLVERASARTACHVDGHVDGHAARHADGPRIPWTAIVAVLAFGVLLDRFGPAAYGAASAIVALVAMGGLMGAAAPRGSLPACPRPCAQPPATNESL